MMESNINALYKALCAPFNPKAIRWRAQQIYDGKALALAYVDARDVQDRLDKVVGFENWQCDYKSVGPNRVAAGIGIYLGESLGWIWKWDGAGETQVEGEKGAFSDSFKRAAVKWGVARYLYDLGNTWVPCETREHQGKQKFKRFAENNNPVTPWDYVNMNTIEIKKQIHEDLIYINGGTVDTDANIKKLGETSVELGYPKQESIRDLKGAMLFDIAYNLADQAAAIQEMEKENADRENN
jgi:hypothetical protein